MSNHTVTYESILLDELGSQVNVWYVNLRRPTDRSLVRTLVKGCEARFAIDRCKKLRISKADQFREYGEVLIHDPLESYAVHLE